MALFFPPIQIYNHTLENELFKNFYFTFRLLLISIPSLLTYGVLMFKFGKRNYERYDIALKIAGILGITGYALTIPFLFSIFSIQLAFFAYFSFFGGLFIIAEYVLLIAHGKKNRDIYIGISGIVLIIGMIISGIIAGLLISLELSSI